MKAKFEPRIDLKNRTKLESVIPLETPFVVFLDPSDACNLKCRFCPTSDRALMKLVNRPWKQLSFDLFKKIADDMTLFPGQVQVLRLYKDGEPLLNKNLADMVKYAKDVGSAKRIDTTTNASLLTVERGQALVDAGLDQINISIYGVNTGHYNAFSGVKIEFEKVLANVREFYEIRKNCEMLVKINGDQLSEREREQFLEYFGDYTDKIYIENTMSCWPEFQLRGVEVNNEKGIYGQEIKEVNTCPYPFYSFSINSDGLASVCFLDWGRKLIVGDTKLESVQDIWNGKLMRAYRKMFLDGNRKPHKVCGNCGQMTHGLPDNLDPHKELLLQKLNEIEYFKDVPDLINRII
ncbi:radical SAM/SPASM domain-containing protein [Aeromonas sp.]|uniref:radical SAM/SPASM domain-containing protein n=1 Tax=Aeromonas sp. TaxID=647 RepID=UPI002584F067|nr:radical SAM/SPASM domain-containing protein [Aeromonas sp.]MCX7132357.1 radical SAM/SPASM domain-containing protein [Aeromonas sp.]